MKTVRFAQVVAKSGQPEPYTLWTKPDGDATFSAALKQHRVMTVRQENVGTKKDYGTVGFEKGSRGKLEGSLLIFPKSLKTFEGKRIIGINYDLLAAPSTAEAAKPASKAQSKLRAKAKSKQPVKPKSAAKPAKPAAQSAKKESADFGHLRLFEPDKEPATAARPASKGAAQEEGVSAAADQLKALTREVRKAIKQLQQGKAVAAFQTLESALTVQPE